MDFDGVVLRVNAQDQEQHTRIATLEAELLRVRTTGHAAAHEIDNIAVECGLGHSPKPGDVAANVRQLREAVRVASNPNTKWHNISTKIVDPKEAVAPEPDWKGLLKRVCDAETKREQIEAIEVSREHLARTNGGGK